MVLELLLGLFLIFEVFAAITIITFVIMLWIHFLKIIEDIGYRFYEHRHPKEHKGQ
jgi:uncharacterized membrane protein HdeD (DUF308 family)